MVYVPFIASPPEVVAKMLELLELHKGETLYDLGSGDGRILVTAAQNFGVGKAVGVETREDLVEQSREEISRVGLEDRVQVIHGNLLEVPIGEADVVTLFLTTSANERLKPKLEKELKDGARVVSHDYEVTGWEPKRVENLDKHTIYLYVVKKSS
jgi:tRNA A58 N-methylase Trm61